MKLNERGQINGLLIPLILSMLFFFGAVGFGIWAYMGMQDYKTNVDPKIAAAVKVATDKTKTEKDNEFLQREKEPLRDYQGSIALGSITFKYPKTWSGYFKESNTELTLLMHPKLVPGNDKSLYALKVEVLNRAYDRELGTLENGVKNGKMTADPFRLERLPEVLGTRFDGEIATEKKGSMVLLPLRDKTVKISVESEDFMEDFDNIILKNFTFSP